MRQNEAILERLDRAIVTLQENNQKMGQMLAVHDEKLDKQDRIDAVLFEKVESLHREVNRSTQEIKVNIWWTCYYIFHCVTSRTKDCR